MAVAIHALSIPQWGLEGSTVPGAPAAATVAATKKMAVKDLLIKPTDTVIRESVLKGLAIANRGNEVIGERGIDWEVPETPMVLDELHYWFGMAVVAPTKTGAGPVFTWTSTHVPTSVQARQARTIELRYNDGANSVDAEFQAILTELEFSGAANDVVKLRAAGKGRRIQSSTLTPALALFPIVECPMSLTKVFIDSTYANLGTTQLTGQIVGWRWKLTTGLFGQNTADGRSDQDYSVVLLNPDDLRWTLELDVKANLNTGQWQTEKTAAEALTLRAVELRGNITVGAVAYQFKIQSLLKHTLGSVFPADRNNGEVMCHLSLEGSTDDTNSFALIVDNSITAVVA